MAKRKLPSSAMGGKTPSPKDSVKIEKPKITKPKTSKSIKTSPAHSSSATPPKISQRKRDQSKNAKKSDFTKEQRKEFSKDRKRVANKVRYYKNRYGIDLSEVLNDGDLKSVKTTQDMKQTQQRFADFMEQRIKKDDYLYSFENARGEKITLDRKELKKTNDILAIEKLMAQGQLDHLKEMAYQYVGEDIDPDMLTDTILDIAENDPGSDLGKLLMKANTDYGGEFPNVDVQSIKSNEVLREFNKAHDNPFARVSKMNETLKDNTIKSILDTYGNQLGYDKQDVDKLINAIRDMPTNDFMELFYTSQAFNIDWIYEANPTGVDASGKKRKNNGSFKSRNLLDTQASQTFAKMNATMGIV